MKKIAMIFAFVALCATVNATESTKKPNKQLFACGTAESTLNSDCWSATVTVTMCSDLYDEVTLIMLARLDANKTARSLAPVLEYLN